MPTRMNITTRKEVKVQEVMMDGEHIGDIYFNGVEYETQSNEFGSDEWMASSTSDRESLGSYSFKPKVGKTTVEPSEFLSTLKDNIAIVYAPQGETT